ncbi:hypothetical protein LDENG_00164750, partial [Lucifuga dentata]
TICFPPTADASHRLNLFYLANDVIQNCKRKNAMVYRTAFAEVLPDAFLMINYDGDSKVVKSVERILSIWEERSVYSGTLIAELQSSLVKEESPPETPVEQKTPVDSKSELRSQIVAEFVPQALIDKLVKHKRSLEEVDLREKQLAAMRIDICNSDTLKKLKDKAGGKKFSKDFEEGSAQLQEFVKFLDGESKGISPLLEALSNADIFYEMQYKEVKIVANAYQTFANRVSHLKRKLDSLKATLPDLDESPIPSPSADAPSPTGSESPFHGLEMATPDPDLDGSAMDDEAEPPAPSPLSSLGGSPTHTSTLGENDNREVEDMDLSEEEMESGDIIVEEHVKRPAPKEVPNKVPAKKEPPATTEVSITKTTPTSAAPLAGVDLSKIGSILNNLSSVVKNTVESPAASPPAAPPPASSSMKTTPPASASSVDAVSLVNLLSKVDMTPTELLSTLSKVHRQGSNFEDVASLLSNPAAKVSPDSSNTGKIPPSQSSTSAVSSKTQSLSSVEPVPSPPSPTVRQSPHSQAPLPASNAASALVQALHRDMDMELNTETEPSVSSNSLESKIHNFLQGNPGFNAFNLGFPMNPVAGGDNLSPVAGTDTQDGTPSSTQQVPANPQQRAYLQPEAAQNGQVYQSYPYAKQEMSEHGTATPVVRYHQISGQSGGPALEEMASASASSTKTAEGFQGPVQSVDTEKAGSGVKSIMSGMVIHDHQHKPIFHPDDVLYGRDGPRHHPEDLHRHLEEQRYQKNMEHYHDDLRPRILDQGLLDQGLLDYDLLTGLLTQHPTYTPGDPFTRRHFLYSMAPIHARRQKIKENKRELQLHFDLSDVMGAFPLSYLMQEGGRSSLNPAGPPVKNPPGLTRAAAKGKQKNFQILPF